ncbi:DUF1599 domain-containing protein [bacterium]|nr:DUF1599 domain-containing protein [bacterium]
MKEILDKILNRIRDTILIKNERYGNSFQQTIEEYGPIALLIRLTDKLNRLKTAYKHRESMEDTLLDIAGYAILGLIEIENKKKEK